MKKIDRIIAWFFVLFVFVVGMIIGANLPSNTPTTDEYKQGFDDGYDYAVKTARLTDDDGATYTIVYDNDDGNYYTR